MTIAEALTNAKNTKKVLERYSSEHRLSKLAVDTIEGLMRIIYWYDGNQKRLIKGIVKQSGKAFQLKTKMLYQMVGTIRCLKEHLTEEEKECFTKFVVNELGGDAK